MPTIDDWIKALSKPPDDPALKAIDEQIKMMESIKIGEYIKNIDPEDTLIAKQLAELQKLRQDFEKYRAEYAADKAAQEHRLKLDFRKNVAVSAVSALLTASAANIIAYYWPDIIAFFSGIFQ